MSAKRHESLIKTPKQLVTALVLFFVGTIIVIVLLAQLATSGRNYDEDAKSPEAVAKRIKPVAEVNMGTAGPAGKILKTGEEIYKSVCTAGSRKRRNSATGATGRRASRKVRRSSSGWR